MCWEVQMTPYNTHPHLHIVTCMHTCTYTLTCMHTYACAHTQTNPTSPVGPHLPACHLSVTKPLPPITHWHWMHAWYWRKLGHWVCRHCSFCLELSLSFPHSWSTATSPLSLRWYFLWDVTCVNQCSCKKCPFPSYQEMSLTLWNLSFWCET